MSCIDAMLLSIIFILITRIKLKYETQTQTQTQTQGFTDDELFLPVDLNRDE